MKTAAVFLTLGTMLFCAGRIRPAQGVPPAAPEHGEVMVVNQGSVYEIGYRIFVQPAGHARYVPVIDTDYGYPQAGKVFTGRIPAVQARKLFHDVAAAGVLARLPVQRPLDQPWTKDYMNRQAHQIGWRVQQGSDHSPNLAAPLSPQGQALRDDAVIIARTLHLKNASRH